MVEDDAWPKDTYDAAMAVFAEDGWNEPRMDIYNAMDPRTTTLQTYVNDTLKSALQL